MTRRRLVAGLVVVALTQFSCAGPARSRSDGPREPQQARSFEPTLTLKRLYGDRFEGISGLSEATAYDGCRMWVRLAGGEPTGTEPYAALIALARAVPGQESYDVVFAIPRDTSSGVPSSSGEQVLYGYGWHSRGLFVRSIGDATGSLVSVYPAQMANGIDFSDLQDIASGDAPIPALEPYRPSSPLSEDGASGTETP